MDPKDRDWREILASGDMMAAVVLGAVLTLTVVGPLLVDGRDEYILGVGGLVSAGLLYLVYYRGACRDAAAKQRVDAAEDEKRKAVEERQKTYEEGRQAELVAIQRRAVEEVRLYVREARYSVASGELVLVGSFVAGPGAVVVQSSKILRVRLSLGVVGLPSVDVPNEAALTSITTLPWDGLCQTFKTVWRGDAESMVAPEAFLLGGGMSHRLLNS